MEKRILVTGGAGFLGSHLCKRLVNQGNDVVCLDNLYTSSKKNIVELEGSKNFTFIEHDIINPIDIKVDEIYNLACPASPVHYQRDRVYTTKISIFGALNMLDLATKYDAKILQASTSEVYGDPVVHPQEESYNGNVNPLGIRACYDEGKRCAETLFVDYNRQYRTKIKIMRIFNTYGPHMALNDGRVVVNFIAQALKGENITIYGDGTQTRSFCYVDDLIDGMMALMNSADNIKGPINIGNPDEFTMLEFAKMVLSKIDTNSKLVYYELPQDDPIQRQPDITLAKTMLNWSPKIHIEEGLDKTIEYFKRELA